MAPSRPTLTEQSQQLHAALFDTLKATGEWLKFGEAKNAALLAFNGAGICSLISLINDLDTITRAQQVSSWILSVSLIVGGLASLISFLPKTALINTFNYNLAGNTRSVIFFGDIAAMTPDQYLRNLSHKLGSSLTSHNEYHQDFAHQIVSLSKIANAKFRCFKYGVFITIIGVILSLIAYLGLSVV